jgi:hypothetical protein
MEYIYKNTTFDLRGLPSLQARLEDPAVVTALHNYLDAVMAYKNKMGQLQGACKQSRRRRKTAWSALMDLLGQDCDYSSTEDED